MNKYLLCFIWIFSAITCYGQSYWEDRPRFTSYVNLLGDASIVSINFDVVLLNQEHFFLAAKAGVGVHEEICIVFCNDKETTVFTTVPVALTANFGHERHYFEVGLGFTLFDPSTEWNMLYPHLGYRLHPEDRGRFQFRAYTNVYPLNGDPKKILFIPIGLSFGISF